MNYPKTAKQFGGRAGIKYVGRNRPIPATFKAPCTCGTCGRTWDDAVSTAWTPAPSARCPFEPYH